MENVPTGKIGETEKPISQEKVNEFAKLSWRERICYGAGDLAQNLIFGTIGSMLLAIFNLLWNSTDNLLCTAFLTNSCCSWKCILCILYVFSYCINLFIC